MNVSEIYKIVLVLLLIACAVSVNLTRSLLRSVIIFMSYSSIMCLLWILMESPDLAITEAAVGAGISGYLFLVTLKKLRQIDGMEDGRQREGGAWTDSAPQMDAAAEIPPVFPDGGVSGSFLDGVTQAGSFPDNGARDRSVSGGGPKSAKPKRRAKNGGKRKEGGL